MATTSLSKLNHSLELARKATRRAREKTGEVMETALEAGVIAASAGGLGVWSKKAPGSFKDLAFGIPAPLALAMGGYAASLMGVGRGMEKHIRSAANGCLAAHAFNVGQDFASAGALPASPISGEGVSTRDLLNLARG